MIQILHADARKIPLADASVDCVVTSPPYWGQRDYGVAGQIGLERLHDCQGWAHGACCEVCHVCTMRKVFREVRRVLKPTGTLWLNYGDCYATGAGNVGEHPGGGEQGVRWRGDVGRHRDARRRRHGQPGKNGHGRAQRMKIHGKHAEYGIGPMTQPNRMPLPGLKPKDLVGMAWRIAFALQADGWWLRSDVIWHKPNPMPESVTDRPTKAHEYLFLLAPAERYYFDQAAWAEPALDPVDDARRIAAQREDHKSTAGPGHAGLRVRSGGGRAKRGRPPGMGDALPLGGGGKRNRRTVWTIGTAAVSEAHFAAFPDALAEPCILAGCPRDGVVLDPFCGTGTVLAVANRLGRNAIGIELNPEYVEIANRRVFSDVTPTVKEKQEGQKLLLGDLA